MKKPDLLLCIDFATVTGVAWLTREGGEYTAEVETWVLSTTKEKLNNAQKGLRFKAKIRDSIIKKKIGLVVFEEPFVYSAHIRGIGLNYGLKMLLETECEYLGVPYISVPPTSVKKAVTGKGNSSKDAVRKIVQDEWGIKTKNKDESDALGVGLWAIREIEWDEEDRDS